MALNHSGVMPDKGGKMIRRISTATSKYRYPVLVGDVGQRARELLREIARSMELTIYAGSTNRDHVHMLIGIPPHTSVSKAVQYLKEKSSHKMLTEFPSLKKRYWASTYGAGDTESRRAAL